MSLRDSLELIRMVRPDAGTRAIEHEILAERAASLGLAERRVMSSIAALDAGPQDDAILLTARQAVWQYFVQRELCGFRDHADIIRELGIPARVLAGLGAAPSTAGSR
ncbi:MAG TPA: DUF6665 family protein [Devosiaceae bacterium]